MKALLYSDQDTVESILLCTAAAEAQFGKSQILAKAIFEVEIYSPKMCCLYRLQKGNFPGHPPPHHLPQPCYTIFSLLLLFTIVTLLLYYLMFTALLLSNY